jgi:hypothetical protein
MTAVCPNCGEDQPIVLDEALGQFQCVLCLSTWQAGDTFEDAFEQLMREADEERP